MGRDSGSPEANSFEAGQWVVSRLLVVRGRSFMATKRRKSRKDEEDRQSISFGWLALWQLEPSRSSVLRFLRIFVAVDLLPPSTAR